VTWTIVILFFGLVLVSAAITESVPWVLLLQAFLFTLGAVSLSRSVLHVTD
jgi:hypothetical protein